MGDDGVCCLAFISLVWRHSLGYLAILEEKEMEGRNEEESEIEFSCMSYLENTDKKKRNESRECHVNHCQRYRKWKIEVFGRQKPLQWKGESE